MLLSVLMMMRGFSCSTKEETGSKFCCKTARSYREQANPTEDNSEKKKEDENMTGKSCFRASLPKEVFDKPDESKDATSKSSDADLKKDTEKGF